MIKGEAVLLTRLNAEALAAVQLAGTYGMVDGAHHKQWVIDKMLRCLLGEDYAAWRAEYDRGAAEQNCEPWDEGIAL